MRNDIDVNAQDMEKFTALYFACQNGFEEVVRILLLYREELQRTTRNLELIIQFVMGTMESRVTEKDIQTVIEKAVSRNLADIAVWLLKFEESRNLGSSFYQDLLVKASKYCHLGLVKHLTDQKLAEAPRCDTPSTQGASALIPDENKDCDEEKSSNRNRGDCANTSCIAPAVHRCRRCKKVAYCGTECQHEHWSEHQEDCKPPEKMKKKKKKREKEDDANQGQNSEV